MRLVRPWMLLAAVGWGFTADAALAVADVVAYPSRAVVILVGFALGGATEVSAWNGLAAPRGTPQPLIDKLNAEISMVLAAPEFQRQLEALGGQAEGGSPQQFADHVRGQILKWRALIRSAGLTLE